MVLGSTQRSAIAFPGDVPVTDNCLNLSLRTAYNRAPTVRAGCERCLPFGTERSAAWKGGGGQDWPPHWRFFLASQGGTGQVGCIASCGTSEPGKPTPP